MTLRLAAALVVALLAAGCQAASTPSDYVEVPGLGATRVDVTRPSGPAGAICDANAVAGRTSRQTVVQRLDALRVIGLFADRETPTAELAREIEADQKAVFGEGFSPDDPWLDIEIAAADKSRVWWADLEADVDESNAVYRDVLEAWASISGGSFAPTSIEESWKSAVGPIEVTFSQNDQQVTLRPAYLEDWIDPTILVAVNDLVRDSGRQFELYRAFDQTAFVISLSTEEKRALERDRGWCFEWPSTP